MAQQHVELILFRQLATTLALPIFLVDDAGDLAFLNEAAERVLGLRFDDLGEMSFDVWTTAFLPRTPDGARQPAASLPLVRAILDRRPAHGQITITGLDGVDRRLEVTAFPLDAGNGRMIGAVAMFWEAGPT